MKKNLIFALVCFFGSISLHAGDVQAVLVSSKVDFNYFNRNSAYSCDFAKAKLKKYAETLGANLANLKCSGGIEPESPTSNWRSIWLTADLSSLTQASDNDYDAKVSSKLSEVTLRGRDACDFSVSLIEHLLTKVDHELIKKSSTCWDSKGSFKYSVKVLTAN